MQGKRRFNIISILLILAILASGISFNYELAYSLFPCANLTEYSSTINKHSPSDINKDATIEESIISRLSFYSTKSSKRNNTNPRLVSFLHSENIFSKSTNLFFISLSKIFNVTSSNDIIIYFIHRQDGKK